MTAQVVAGAGLSCSFGAAPSALAVAPVNGAACLGAPAATIMDFAPAANVPPFGMCSSPSNPAVAAANSPQPCVPVITAPWAPGSAVVRLWGQPALDNSSTCRCAWLGVIAITSPGQARMTVL